MCVFIQISLSIYVYIYIYIHSLSAGALPEPAGDRRLAASPASLGALFIN